jgi:hypothetical protein
MTFLKSLFCFWILSFSLHLPAMTLNELVKPPSSPTFFIYRWSSQVVLIQFNQSLDEATGLQMPLNDYYKNKTPLPMLLKQQGFPLNEASIWKKLLSSPLRPHPNPPSWRPSLYFLNKLGLKIDWNVWQITLETPLEEAPQLRHFTLYTLRGEDLENYGLFQNIPCWIENHDTLHKWSMFLMDIYPHPSAPSP